MLSADARVALTAKVKRAARDAGFDLAGITSAEDFPYTEQVVLDRIKGGLMDGLPWFHEERIRRGCHPSGILPEARSIIALGLSYRTEEPEGVGGGTFHGRVAQYAWGRDYHKEMERKAKVFLRSLEHLGGGKARFYVDYGPMPDRAVAERAGLGWFGKNTNILTADSGSWVFLAEVLTDLDLYPDEPLKKSCGSCTACIPACPTNAIPAPYVVDNTRCIAYHTIENRGEVPRHLRANFGGWVFGCDICQDVCPVNDRNASAQGGEAFTALDFDRAYPDLVALLELSESEFERRFHGTPIMRTGHVGMQRNACIGLGNIGNEDAVPVLARSLELPNTVVRSHAAWALGRIGGAATQDVLVAALGGETDPGVREEIEAALGECRETDSAGPF